MDTLMSVCSNPGFHSVAELSLSVFFRRDWSSLYKAVTVHQPEKAPLSMAELGAPYRPRPWKGRFHVLGTDYTSNPRPYAFQLTQQECVYKSTPIKGQKPIAYGHIFHHINSLVEKSGPHCPSWAPPLTEQRVCLKDRESAAIRQMQALLEDSDLPYSREPCIQVGDS